VALTLVEASKLSNDTLVAGVIETMAQESPVLQRLPFIEITGNGLTYNREDSAPTAAFYDVGDTWDEDTPTFEQATAVLKILGGDADIDNFLKTTRSNVQDLEAAVVQLKARAVQTLFDDTFINGDEGSDPNSFDGVDALATAGQTVSMGTNGDVLSLDKLDELVDKIRGGKPDLLLMSRRTRLPRSRPRRLRGDDAVLRWHPHRCERLHQRRPDGGHQQRLQHGLRRPVRRRRPERPDSARRPHRRARRQPGDEGCLADQGEVVRQRRPLQHREAGQAGGHPAVGAQSAPGALGA
jgi:hypothetical protein